jgi:diguanylate cyclase (GGDEF)-like protein
VENLGGGILRHWRQWIDPTFTDPDLEEKYNAAYLEENISITRISIMIWQGANLALIGMDYLLLGFGRMFLGVLGLRLCVFAYFFMINRILRRIRLVAVYQHTLFVAMIIGASVFLLINLTRPPTYLQHTVVDVVGVLCLYLFFPNRFLYRLIPALLLTIGSILLYIFIKTVLNPGIILVTLVSYGLVNFLGLLISARLFGARRKEFQSHLAEQAAQAKIAQLAMEDDLTGIANRRHFYRQAEAEFAHFQRSEQPLVLLMLDLDHFKRINDKYGHGVGDAALIRFAKFVAAQIRQEDLFGRVGGEEFAVLLRDATIAQAAAIGDRIRLGVAQLPIPGGEPGEHFTVSIGLAAASGRDASFDGLFGRADGALYMAKKLGRNRLAMAGEELKEGGNIVAQTTALDHGISDSVTDFGDGQSAGYGPGSGSNG